MSPKLKNMFQCARLITGIQQLEDTFSILLRNMRSWLNIVGLGTNDEVVNKVRREDLSR